MSCADTSPGTAVRTATIAGSFQTRRNSLNFLRLALALTVVWSHSIRIGGFGGEGILGKTTLGTLAVYGFFGISGYLIAGSASKNHVGRYLWQRFLRIFPAFWVCLIVTAFVFGLIGWFHFNPVTGQRCGVSCYLSEPQGPWGYLFHNFWLRINQQSIANSLHQTALLNVWNGSLWTLFFEFLCYLMLAGLAGLGLLRRREVVAALAATVWMAEIFITWIPSLNRQFSATDHWNAMNLLSLVPIFLAGSLLYLYRDEIPDSGALAWCCTVLALVGLVLPIGNSIPAFTLTSMVLTAPFIAYPMIWLGIHLPFHRIGARNDYSYGVYIYAFPVQQLLVIWGVARWGYWPYTLLSTAAVLPLAVASWWTVERNALKLKKFGVRPSGA